MLDIIGVKNMMKKTKLLCAFVVFLFVGSLAVSGVNAYVSISTSTDQMIPAETYGDDRRNEAVSILIYSEVADTDPGGEWDHVMGSLIGSLEGKFTYENLTDYTQLGSMIEEFDVLLLLESENGNYTFCDAVAAAWSGILPSYVSNGGIVIAMSVGYSLPQYGSTARIINGTLLDVYNFELANGHQVDVFDANDALARDVAPSFTGPTATMSFDVPDAVKVLEDNTDAKPVAVHKIIGKGHVVLMGFDFFTIDTNTDKVLANAVRLHRHVLFDGSHVPGFNIFNDLEEYATDLLYAGFAVGEMSVFNADDLLACDVLVIPRCSATYSPGEIDIIEDFVLDGGGLFIIGEWGSLMDELDPIIERFGYARNQTSAIQDTDDNAGNPNWPVYDGNNIKIHSITVDVAHVEAYAGSGLIETPVNAFNFVVTDSDGTAQYHQGPTPIMEELAIGSASHHGMGRLVVWGDTSTFDGNSDTDTDGDNGYYDGDNEVMAKNIIRWLYAAGIPEQTVVFDQSHVPYMSIHATWNPLANFLMLNGYNVEWMNTFDPVLYEDADILVINDGSTDYNATEIAHIADYVAGGGGLLLWGDNTVFCQQIDPIGQEFGLFVNTTGALTESDDYDTYDQYTIFEGNNIGNHPIMDGVERIEVDLSNAFISIGSGTALVSTDSDGTTTWGDGTPAINLPVYAATTHNMGRVVFLTDVELGFLTDPEGDGFGDLYDSDNPIFLGNVFKWLAENRAPTVEVIAPNGGELLNGTITVSWDAVDFDSDPMTFDVYVSDNNGSDWSLLAGGLILSEYEWNTTMHDDGNSYMILVEVFAGELSGQDVSDNPFELDNFAEPGPGLPIDPMLLALIGAGVIVIVLILVILSKKKGGGKK